MRAMDPLFGMALLFAPVQEQTWMMTLPAFSQTLVFGTFMRGEVPELGQALVSMSATALFALLLVALAAWLYEREQLIFGG